MQSQTGYYKEMLTLIKGTSEHPDIQKDLIEELQLVQRESIAFYKRANMKVVGGTET